MPSKKTSHSNPNTKTYWLLRPVSLKILSALLLCFVGALIYLDAQVRYKFEGKRWALPAKVYARALEIYDGKALNLHNLEQELALLNYQHVADIESPGTYHVTGDNIEIFSRAHYTPNGKQNAEYFQFSLINDVVQNLASHGAASLYTLEPYKIGGIYPRIKEERILLPYEAFPEALKSTLIVTEDRDFKNHIGLSPLSILRAAWANLKAGRVVQGGSTLTQQLVKNFYLTRERSITRKVNEALMSILLEAHYDKQDILETYMNDIFLGQSGALAIHGFGAASYFYFGKSVAECELPEFALLVAMVKGPSYYNPRRFPERAIKRRNHVLSLLRDEKVISPNDYRIFSQSNLGVISKPKKQTNRFPAFMDLVKRQLQSDYDDEDLRTEGLQIYTTLDPQIQLHLEHSVQTQVNKLEQLKKSPMLQAGAVVTSAGTGEVLALLGDKQTQYNGFNRALDANRPIGSLIKPAIFLSALAQPEQYNLASLLPDQAFKIEFENGQTWMPQNFDHKEHGDIPLHRALSKSYNLSTARLGIELGIPTVHDIIRKLGIDKTLNPYPSLFLGAQSLSPFEVTQLYQTIASNGFNIPLRAIREVSNNQGETLSRYPFKIEQVVSPEAIFLLHHALQDVMRSGTGRSAYQQLPDALHVAGKTGTTNDNRDSWFAGFSGDYLAVFWLGRDDNKPTNLTGSSGALRVWTDFIKRIPQYPISMVKPKQVSYYWFDKQNGKRTNEQCRGAEPLPIWGSVDHLDFQSCQSGYSSISGWFKSWF